MGRAFLAFIPDLIVIVLIVAITRYGLKLLHLVFLSIEFGKIKVAGFDPDWARPTYKIMRFLVLVFAAVVIYPYVPGSQSAAFKGISIFVGIMFSLGSSSAISNVIAGYSLTYRRAFKVGDRVEIGEVIGDVTEMRMQVTHLRTIKNEEVTIPNSTILGTPVVNFSSLVREGGLILHTTVTIGYDTPWRQVHAMLLLAAERTEGLLADPKPFVLQTGLNDFYVSYELNCYTDQPRKMARSYSDLHQNIQDVFNEFGVQIMSPHYESDPAQAKIVLKEQWHQPPAMPEETTGKGESTT
jgi:small-conductance mechanosensitive channel